MADEGSEAFHVPQRSRRDKLRVTLQNSPTQAQSSAPSPNNPPFTPMTMLANSNFSYPNPPPFSLLLLDSQQYDRVSFRGEFRSSVPLGPFTGYASILKRSRFLKPAQQLLEDFSGSGRSDSGPPPLNYLTSRVKDPITAGDRVELQFKNSKLKIMLEEVYKRYKLYCQQMESVVASFETIDGLGNAAPYISFAIKAILKHFGCLKNAILDKLQSRGNTSVGDFSLVEDETRGFSERGLHSQNPSHQNLTKNPHQSVLRCQSQRGLPEHAVAVLRTWLFEHFLHPYPTDSEKQMLTHQTGLSRTQVSNWFINSRVRLWKPMVEEIHNLETQQAQTLPDTMNKNEKMASLTTPSQKAQDNQTKRSRNKQHCDMSEQSETTQRNAAVYGSLTSNDLQMSTIGGISRTTGSHEVSLALSLQPKK